MVGLSHLARGGLNRILDLSHFMTDEVKRTNHLSPPYI